METDTSITHDQQGFDWAFDNLGHGSNTPVTDA